jgi:hypothetical protein
MIKALSAIAISAFIAAAVSLLPGFAPQLQAGEPLALQKGKRLVIHTIDRDCTSETWPNFSTSCLRGSDTTLEPRLVSSNRG